MVGMAYMSGSKRARNVDSITAIPNCGGTAKKSGSVSSGPSWFTQHNVHLTRAPHTQPTKCVVFRITQVQQNRNGYSISHGGSGLG